MSLLHLGEPQFSLLEWTVTDAGEVTIWEGSWQANWNGTVDADLNVSLQRTFTFYVGDEPTTRATTYHSTIEEEAGTYTLEMEGIEEWFPPDQDYVFRRVYSLQKTH